MPPDIQEGQFLMQTAGRLLLFDEQLHCVTYNAY